MTRYPFMKFKYRLQYSLLWARIPVHFTYQNRVVSTLPLAKKSNRRKIKRNAVAAWLQIKKQPSKRASTYTQPNQAFPIEA